MSCPVCHQFHDTTACPLPTITVTPAPQQGWECPKCHAVMAPFQLSCIHCLPMTVTFTGAPLLSPGD